jgi:RHS repeat-associated protein
MINRGRSCFLLAALALYGASPARADIIYSVSVSGQFGSGVTADQLAAPDGTWALSFDVDSNPAATNTDAFSFDAPFSDFTYLLNGSAVAVSPQSIRLYESGDGGLFTLFFGPETGFFNGMPIPEFSFSGGQVFSGTPGSPMILPGSYPVSDVTYSDAINYDDEGASGTVTIAAPQSTVPEPSTFRLILTGVSLTLFARIRKFRLGNKGISAAFILALLLPMFSVSAQAQLSLSGTWTGTRTETGVVPEGLPAQSNQVLILYQAAPGDPVIGTLSTFWPGTPYYWNAVATGAVSGNSLVLTWAIIPQTVNLPSTAIPCSETENLSLSVSGDVITATVPTYNPCGQGTSTIESYPLTLVGWQEMLGKDDSGGTSCSWFCGDPIDISTGNVFEQITDYQTSGANQLSFIRYYNSYSPPPPPPTGYYVQLNIPHWTTNYDRSLIIDSTGTHATALRPDGEQLTFNLVSGTWTPDSDVDMMLTGSGNTWTLTGHDDTAEAYQVTIGAASLGIGRLNSITTRNGYTQTLTYNGNQLFSVTDSYGRQLVFSYTNGLLTQVTTPDTLVLTYSYGPSGIISILGSNNLLASVSYNTSPVTKQTYTYLPGSSNLSSIIDENGNVYTSFAYDGYGRAVSSQRAGGAGLTTVTYNDTTGTRTVTNALGEQETYTFVSLKASNKVTQISRAANGSVAAATRTLTYDTNGFVASATDWNGNHTTYTNDVHGDPLTVVEASGTAVSRTTTVAYDSRFVHLPNQIVTPGLTTGFTYDGSGEMLTRTLTDTTTTSAPYSTNGQTRTWTNTWSSFLLASSTTPNSNTTLFSYDGSGALIRTTNALGQATNITAHTGGGLPQTMVDPNGVTTTFAYDARLRLLTSTVATSQGLLTTTYSYDAAGNLIKTTLPDGSALTNTYDPAHRLTTITDLFHQSTAYTLDALGDRTQTNLTAVGNRIQRQHSDGFDVLGRVLKDTGGAGQATAYTYDSNGNALTITDPLGRVTHRTFDALNRLSSVTDPNSGITTTTYDTHNRILSVTDANGHATTYLYDGFGDLIQQVSPDSGKTIYHYDADGNLRQKIDAAGNITNNAYDTLDRVLATSYPADATLNVAYTYDQAGHGFGIGRLTSLADAAGTLSRSYNERGNMLNETRATGTTTLQTLYSYDAASRIASITYPSGWTVSQTRDIMGRVWQLPIATPGNAPAGNAITNATYKPFGPLNTLTYGNGVNEARNFDLDYRVTALADAGATAVQGLTYGYDAADNVLSIADAVTPGNSQAFGYDVLDRLTSAAGAYGSLGYAYDKVGNRLTQTLGATTTSYAYSSGTNRLASITASGITTPVSYTATGNISSIPPTPGAPVATLTYSAANRFKSETGTAVAIAGIVYDAFGKRISKSDPGANPLLFTYDQSSRLLEETDGHGALIDYIYLNGRPVAEITGGQLYYLHADRLGTPQVATNSSQNVVWGTTYQPFGTTAIPVGPISQNLRFPGQYADGETGFSYNINRDYVPGLGRYLETDRIGLSGGINTYAYGLGNPLRTIDRYGTECEDRWVITLCVILGLCAKSPEPVDIPYNPSGPVIEQPGPTTTQQPWHDVPDPHDPFDPTGTGAPTEPQEEPPPQNPPTQTIPLGPVPVPLGPLGIPPVFIPPMITPGGGLPQIPGLPLPGAPSQPEA